MHLQNNVEVNHQRKTRAEKENTKRIFVEAPTFKMLHNQMKGSEHASKGNNMKFMGHEIFTWSVVFVWGAQA